MAEAAFTTPPARRARQQRTSLGSVASSSNRSSRRGSSLLGSGIESDLTPSGTQILHAGLKRSGRPLALQVLGVYRYMADPVLRGVLPPQAVEALEWDVFDLVVSDGQMKMKAMLSPALNDLVWRGLVGELDIVEIDDYELLTVHDDDDDGGGGHHTTLHQPRSVCIIHELTPRAPLPAASQANDDASDNAPASQSTIPTPRAKIVYSVGSALLPSPLVHGSASGVPDLQFISEAHIRDHGALPLAGKRLYYLSLLSDDYPADWEPVQCEPLTPVSRATPWAEWNRRRRYCTDIFTSQDRKVHTIREVNVMTSHDNRKKRPASELDEDSEAQPSTMTPPPMIGIVQFKSALVHTGAPNVVNEFPFMFHIVLVDRERMVAVAFFGSMAAMHFLVVQEGDVVQLEGYLVTRSAPREDEKSKKLFVFPHKSTGVVSLVPDKYWKLLETMQVLEKRPRPTPSGERGDHDLHSTVWFEPFFWNTLHTQHVRMSAEEADSTHFDFVGVASFVSRVHRHRPHRDGSIDANTVASLAAYRWLKMIDAHSTSELVVRLYVNSQPTPFHAIQAGDMVLLSKLKWVRPHSSGGGMAFASSSPFTTIRLNDAVEPYHIFSACSENVAFAKTLQASGGCKSQYAPLGGTTESWLEGPAVHDYEPLHSVVSMLDSVDETLTILADGTDSADVDDPRQHWIPMFTPDDLSLYPFEDVAAIAESMDAMSHQYIRVHVALHDIRAAHSHTEDDVADIEFLVTDSNRQSERPPQPLRLRSNLLFREPALPSPLDELVAADAESLARLLTPSALTSLNTASILRSTELPHFSPVKVPLHSPAAESDEQQITLATVKEYILKSRQGAGVGGIDVALHLYRLPQGGLDLWIDGISLEG